MSNRAITLLVVAALAAGLGLWASQRYFSAPAETRPTVASFNLLPTPRAVPPFVLHSMPKDPTAKDWRINQVKPGEADEESPARASRQTLFD